MSGYSSRLSSTVLLAACAAAVFLFAGVDARGADTAAKAKSPRWIAPANPDRLRAAELTFNATPNVLPIHSNSAIVNMAGDDDGFGFGYGWIPPTVCTTFDNRGPEDLGVFDQRQPTSAYNSICNFSGQWTHSFPVPPGGVGQLTLQMRILGGQGDVTSCAFSPCGCTTPAQTLFINGVQQPFFNDPGCASIIMWSGAWQGPAANALAGSGSLAIQVNWNNDAFAIDYSRVTLLPAVEVAVLDGDGQRGAVTNALEKPLRVKFTSQDPTFSFSGTQAIFQVTSVPAHASGYGIGASETSISTTSYSAAVDSSGVASAVLVLGDKEGQYVVQVKSPLSITGNAATFTETAVKPDSVVILKDSPDLADRAPTYAVSSAQSTDFYAIGLDANGASLGRVKSNWSVSSGGNPATRGSGNVSPSASSGTTTFTPSAVGQLTLKANPNIAGVNTASADLFITAVYVDIDGQFLSLPTPVDQLPDLIPGSIRDGSSVPISVMQTTGQTITIYVLTGSSSRGHIDFSLANVSQYPGIAMNWPIDSNDNSFDMDFGSGGLQTISVDFSGTDSAPYTPVTLHIRDYAAHGTVKIQITSGKKTYTVPDLKLPIDKNNNGIPDKGWRVENNWVADTGLDPGGDEDDNPVMRPVNGLYYLPNDGRRVGDNLTNFEEYRGFVLNGEHVRTDPFWKDLFINGDTFAGDIQFAWPALPTITHLIRMNEMSVDQVVNTNWAGLPGATSPAPNGHTDQVAMLLEASPSSGFSLGETLCPGSGMLDSPCVPNYALKSTIFLGTIANDAALFGITDPALTTKLRQSTVAHEVGHSVNLIHNDDADCMMFGGSFTQYVGFNNIPTDFCAGINTDLIDCTQCGSLGLMLPVVNFNETDTLRIKEDSLVRIPQ